MIWIIVYYDNKFKRFGNFKSSNVTKSEDIQQFENTTPKDFAIINIIEL